MSEGEREAQVHVKRDRCPYCHDEVTATPERTACNVCAAWHHQACWDEHRGCSACGFTRPAESAASQAQCDWSEQCHAPAVERVARHTFCRPHARTTLLWIAGILGALLLCTSVLAALEGPGAYGVSAALASLAVAVFGLLWVRLRRLRPQAPAATEKDPS